MRDASLAAHFAYGAATGALCGFFPGRNSIAMGAAQGVAVWAASYLGWVPGASVLRPATSHPPRRNALMIAAHCVWGAATAWTISELRAARLTILRNGALKDKELRVHELPAHNESAALH